MSRPLAISNFCALITGGSSAPSEGGAKITMVSFSAAWALAPEMQPNASADTANASAVKRVRWVFMSPSLSIHSLVDAEQLLLRPAADRRHLDRLQTGIVDDRHRLVVADWKRHVGAEHDTIGAHHLDDKTQHPRVVLDGVGVEQAQRLHRIGRAGRDAAIALEAEIGDAPVRPAADHLPVDAALLHPGEPPRDVAQALHRRPRRLGIAEAQCQPRLAVDDLQRLEFRPILADGREQVRRDEMAVGVDDHSVFQLLRYALSVRPRESGDPVLLDRQTLIKVSPCRVHLFDDLELPGAIPFLQLAFADQSLLSRFMLLIPDQCLDVIALREPGKHPTPMHPNTLDQVVGRPNVERAISLTGKDIHVESHSRGPGSPLPRGRTEKLPITSMKLSHRALRLPCRRAAPP